MVTNTSYEHCYHHTHLFDVCRHGDMIHLTFLETPHLHTSGETTDSHVHPVPATHPGPAQEFVDIDQLRTIQQDPVDDLLEQQDGLISRPKDSNL